MIRIPLGFVLLSFVVALTSGCCHNCTGAPDMTTSEDSSPAAVPVSGHYLWDKDDLRERMEAEVEATEDPDERAGQEMIMEMFEALTFRITLNEDGSASALYGSEGTPDNLAGSWSRDGDRLRVELGNPGYDNEEEFTGTIGDGFIRLTPAAMGIAEPVTFRRQSE